MAKGTRAFGNFGRRFWILFATICLAAGVFIFANGMLEARSEPVERAAAPVVASAPKAVDKPATAEPAKASKPAEKQAPDKEAQQKPAEEQAPEEAQPAEQAEAQPVEQPEAQPTPAAAPADTTLYLTVPKMGRYNDPVANSVDPGVLTNGAGKLPASGFPWQPGSNTYIAAHVYGYPGTGSWQQFAALPSMTYGDEILLTDANGTTYTYRVTEILTVSPYDVWVTAPVPGKTMVSLQTCTGPGWSERLIVRGELVSTS